MKINTKQKLFIRNASIGEFHTVCLPCSARPSAWVRVFTVRCRDIDGQQVFLQETDRMKAGHGYVFLSDRRRAVFYGEGDWVTAPIGGEPLSGTFTKCPELNPHHYLLHDNAWYTVGERLSIEAYCASLNLNRLPYGQEGLPMTVHQETLL